MICDSVLVSSTGRQTWASPVQWNFARGLLILYFVEEGNTRRARAAHFRVSIKFVNDMVKLKRETGSLEPKPQGRRGHGKLAGSHDWVRCKIESKPDVRLDELVSALRRECGIEVYRSAMWGLVHRLGLSHKKRPLCQRAEAA